MRREGVGVFPGKNQSCSPCRETPRTGGDYADYIPLKWIQRLKMRPFPGNVRAVDPPVESPPGGDHFAHTAMFTRGWIALAMCTSSVAQTTPTHVPLEKKIPPTTPIRPPGTNGMRTAAIRKPDQPAGSLQIHEALGLVNQTNPYRSTREVCRLTD